MCLWDVQSPCPRATPSTLNPPCAPSCPLPSPEPILHTQDHPRCSLYMPWTHPVPPGPAHSPEPTLLPPHTHTLNPSCTPQTALHPSCTPKATPVVYPSPILPHQAPPQGPGSQGRAGAGVWRAPTFCQSPWGMERWRAGQSPRGQGHPCPPTAPARGMASGCPTAVSHRGITMHPPPGPALTCFKMEQLLESTL